MKSEAESCDRSFLARLDCVCVEFVFILMQVLQLGFGSCRPARKGPRGSVGSGGSLGGHRKASCLKSGPVRATAGKSRRALF